MTSRSRRSTPTRCPCWNRDAASVMWPLTTEGGRVLSWSNDGREILVATLSGHIAGYPVSTDRGSSHGQPTTLVRDVGSAAAYSSATRDHSRILIRVSPDAANDKGEIRLRVHS